MLKLTITEF